ncbi:MAG: tyrosine--tRNA ligase, partial [Flavobacteriaceae bacterium]
FALTCPLITKADGTKFGKTEQGNVWLDRDRTSPYKFYQYWLNSSDVDAENFIKIFTFLDQQTVEQLIEEHRTAPHMRILQQRLADEITILVHSQEDLDKAKQASQLLFGKSTTEDLKALDVDTLLDVFEGVPQAQIQRDELDQGLDMIAALSAKTGFLNSNGDARRELKQNSISVNKNKVSADFVIGVQDLIQDKYILIQRGKKNYFLIEVV